MFKKFTSVLINLGKGMPSAVNIVQGLAMVSIIGRITTLGDDAQGYFQRNFADIAEQNPSIHFFLIACIIIFITSFVISLAYKTFGLKMHRSTRSYVLIAPFLCVLFGMLFYGYTNYHVHKGFVPIELKETANRAALKLAFAEQGTSHQQLAEKYRRASASYVHKMIESSETQLHYFESMIADLSIDELNKKHKQTVTWNAATGREAIEIEITPYMWAAYLGRMDFIIAANASNKIKADEYIYDIETKVNCKDYTGKVYGVKYTVVQTMTPYKLAIDNNNTTVADSIYRRIKELGADKREGRDYYAGYAEHREVECKIGKSEDRTRVGDMARLVFAPVVQAKNYVFGFGKKKE